MVWARRRLLIEDDLIVPPPGIVRLHYSGPYPTKIYEEAKDLLVKTFTVRVEDLQEKSYTWTTTEGGEEIFKVSWELIKALDKFSHYRITITFEGSELEGKGKVSTEIVGVLRTEYPQDTVWQRSLIYEILRMFWHSIFYRSRRYTYLIEGRRLMNRFITDLKAYIRMKR